MTPLCPKLPQPLFAEHAVGISEAQHISAVGAEFSFMLRHLWEFEFVLQHTDLRVRKCMNKSRGIDKDECSSDMSPAPQRRKSATLQDKDQRCDRGRQESMPAAGRGFERRDPCGEESECCGS